ncbi:MAG: hypothetical protein NUV60_03460 [Patescibacteria group bacterium]|nr:hypothetical protein [Patescibacteria group bacterium]
MQTQTSQFPRRGILTLKGVISREPAKQPTAVPAAESAKTSSRPVVEFKDGVQFVLIFSCPRTFVPEGIQTPPADGGNGVTAGSAEEGLRFSKAKVDLGGLLARCTVDSINVREQKGYCRVYVNCTIAANGDGFGPWKGSYERFVRRELARVWKRAVAKLHPDGKTSLELRDICKDAVAGVTIRFAIKG